MHTSRNLARTHLLKINFASRKERALLEMHENGLVFLDSLKDLETILTTNENFLLGRWLKSAKALATNKQERKLYEFNARNQLTLWGPDGEILDYAGKQWSGMFQDYYIPRWQLFFKSLETSLVKGTRFNQTRFINKFKKVLGKPFCLSTKSYPVKPSGDAVDIAVKLYQKWSLVFNDL